MYFLSRSQLFLLVSLSACWGCSGQPTVTFETKSAPESGSGDADAQREGENKPVSKLESAPLDGAEAIPRSAPTPLTAAEVIQKQLLGTRWKLFGANACQPIPTTAVFMHLYIEFVSATNYTETAVVFTDAACQIRDRDVTLTLPYTYTLTPSAYIDGWNFDIQGETTQNFDLLKITSNKLYKGLISGSELDNSKIENRPKVLNTRSWFEKVTP